jgi:predicted O-methyltransferase YrrM
MVEHRRHPDHPWLTSQAIGLLDQLLKRTDVGVEFGSGRSTAWFAARVGPLTSIENDPKWYEIVSGQLRGTGADYIIQTDPDAYVAETRRFDDGSVDFCLIDGIERDRCAEAMLPKMRSGGIFAVDNVNWFLPNDWTKSPSSLRTGYASPTWQRVAGIVSNWRHIWTSNGVTDTALWFKP